MNASIAYISESGKMAIVRVEKKFGPVTSHVEGWMTLNDDSAKKGDTFTIPDSMSVSVDVQITKDGSEFRKLVLY